MSPLLLGNFCTMFRQRSAPLRRRDRNLSCAGTCGARKTHTAVFHLPSARGMAGKGRLYATGASAHRRPGPEIDAIFGDGITTTSHRLMAAVFDPEPLYDIILDPNAEEFIRAGMCKALAMVTLRGELDQAVAGRFLRDASRIAVSRSTLGSSINSCSRGIIWAERTRQSAYRATYANPRGCSDR